MIFSSCDLVPSVTDLSEGLLLSTMSFLLLPSKKFFFRVKVNIERRYKWPGKDFYTWKKEGKIKDEKWIILGNLVSIMRIHDKIWHQCMKYQKLNFQKKAIWKRVVFQEETFPLRKKRQHCWSSFIQWRDNKPTNVNFWQHERSIVCLTLKSDVIYHSNNDFIFGFTKCSTLKKN